jgi:hypothetical protein
MVAPDGLDADVLFKPNVAAASSASMKVVAIKTVRVPNLKVL